MAKLKVYDRLQDLTDVELLQVPGLQFLTWDFAAGGLVSAYIYKHIPFTFDGSGFVLAGPAPANYTVEQNMTLVGWTLVAKESGSLTLTVKKGTYTAFPTVGSITGGGNPALSTAQKAADTILSGWSPDLLVNDILEVDISGTPVTITKATLFLKVRLV